MNRVIGINFFVVILRVVWRKSLLVQPASSFYVIKHQSSDRRRNSTHRVELRRRRFFVDAFVAFSRHRHGSEFIRGVHGARV